MPKPLTAAERYNLFNLALTAIDRLLDDTKADSHVCPTCNLTRHSDLESYKHKRSLEAMSKRLTELREENPKQ